MSFYINGSYVSEKDAKISILDLGLVRGYGVFDYLRTYNQRPFHLHDHLLRLKYSAEHIGITLPHSLAEIQTIIETLVMKMQGLGELGIKIIVTGGTSQDLLMPQENPSFLVHVCSLKPFPPTFYTQGIRAVTTTLLRSIPMSKTLQYTPAIMALQQSKAKDAQEALYLNANKEILEATTSNFFGFKQGVLITPCSDEILLGITREVVLRLAEGLFPISIRPIHYDEIGELEEAFITSSNKEVMPLVQIDDYRVGTGLIGEKTQRLMSRFAEYTRLPSWPNLILRRYEESVNSSLLSV